MILHLQQRRRHSLALLPSHMKDRASAAVASYNDPALMFPSAARLFRGTNWIAVATAASATQVSRRVCMQGRLFGNLKAPQATSLITKPLDIQ